jgi:rubrerythrin
VAVRNIDKDYMARDEDWDGNNAAFSCPCCGKVFLVSGYMHEGKRVCPVCQDSTGYVIGAKDSGGSARIEWPNSD